MASSKHQKRHYYAKPDTTSKMRKFKWYKKKLKRLGSSRNDVHIAAYMPVIQEYMLRKTKLSIIDLNTLMRLGRLNRTFGKEEFLDAPNKYGRRLVAAQMIRFEDRKYIERWEGHNMNYRRCVQYRLTVRGRSIINEMDQLLLREKKIPLDARYTDHEFVTPKSQLENNKYKINWYAAIIEFNEAVENKN